MNNDTTKITLRVMRYPMPGEGIDEDDDGAYCGVQWREIERREVTRASFKRTLRALKRKYASVQYAIV